MKKQTILIITIITTIISITFSILCYFGIIRYLNMHCISGKNLVKNYKNLPHVMTDTPRNIVVSFTSVNSRLEKIKPMINSILDQTTRVNKIIFVKPMNLDDNSIPDYIKDVANIFPTGKDYGEGMNIIPALLMEKEKDSIIIAIKDDIVYGKDFIETVVSEAEKNPGSLLMDSKGLYTVFSPDCFDCDVVDKSKEHFNLAWLRQKAKKNDLITYLENYKSFY